MREARVKTRLNKIDRLSATAVKRTQRASLPASPRSEMDVDHVAPRRPTQIVDLSRDCLQCIGETLNIRDKLALVACGDKLFSIKWADSITRLACTTSAWRAFSAEIRMGGRAGRTKIPVCLFTQLRSLELHHLCNGKKHAALNSKEIGALPPHLQHLSLALRKTMNTLLLPSTLTSLSLQELARTFELPNALPKSVTQLCLCYKDGHEHLPQMIDMTHLMDLTITSVRPVASVDVSRLPSSLTRLALRGLCGAIADELALGAIGRQLTRLQSLDCSSRVAHQTNRWLDLTVLPPTITHLSESFEGFLAEAWSSYPRSLRSFGDCHDYVEVRSDYKVSRGGTLVTADSIMHELPPKMERIELCDVITPCPLRHVTHLQLSCWPCISQAHIEACRDMTSVKHLKMSYGLDEDSALIQLDICTWQLQSLVVSSRTNQHLNLDHYVPWLTPSLTNLELDCHTLSASAVKTLPASVKKYSITVTGDPIDTIGKVPDELLPFINFRAI